VNIYGIRYTVSGDIVNRQPSTVNRQPSTFNSQLRSCTHHLRSIVLLRYSPLEALDTFIRCLRTFTLHVSVFRVEPYLPILLSSWLEYNVLLSSDKWLSFSCCLVLLRWLESRYRRNHNYTAFTLILNELSNFSIFNSGIYPQKIPNRLKNGCPRVVLKVWLESVCKLINKWQLIGRRWHWIWCNLSRHL
jgi:hypothetical protein